MTLDYQAEHLWMLTFVKDTGSYFGISIFDSLSYPELANSGFLELLFLTSTANWNTDSHKRLGGELMENAYGEFIPRLTYSIASQTISSKGPLKKISNR